MSGGEEKTEAAPAASGGGGSKLVLILTAVNVLATLGMVGIMFMSFNKEKGKPSVDDIAVKAADGHGDKKEEHAAEGGHGGGHGEKKEEKKKSADFGKMVTLEQFTVNLSTPGATTPKFVRVAVSLWNWTVHLSEQARTEGHLWIAPVCWAWCSTVCCSLARRSSSSRSSLRPAATPALLRA